MLFIFFYFYFIFFKWILLVYCTIIFKLTFFSKIILNWFLDNRLIFLIWFIILFWIIHIIFYNFIHLSWINFIIIPCFLTIRTQRNILIKLSFFRLNDNVFVIIIFKNYKVTQTIIIVIYLLKIIFIILVNTYIRWIILF